MIQQRPEVGAERWRKGLGTLEGGRGGEGRVEKRLVVFWRGGGREGIAAGCTSWDIPVCSYLSLSPVFSLSPLFFSLSVSGHCLSALTSLSLSLSFYFSPRPPPTHSI